MRCHNRWAITVVAGWALCAPGARATDYIIKTSINDPSYKDECTVFGATQAISAQSNAFYPACAPGTAFNTIVATVPQVDVTAEMWLTGHTTVIRGIKFVAKGNTRIFRLAGTPTLLIERSRLQDGHAVSGSGGAILVEQGNLSLDGVTLADNEADTDGGALAFGGSGLLATKYSSFERNKAGQHGGALALGGQTPAGEQPVMLMSTRFLQNEAFLGGGALHCSNSLRMAVVSLGNFLENKVVGGSGTGGALSSFCDMDILTSRFRKNTVDHGRGGALYLAGPSSIVRDADIRENLVGTLPGSLGEGGGIYLDGGADIIRAGLHKNGATTAGGGLFVGNAAGGDFVKIANVTFDANVATSGATPLHGGAIHVTGSPFPLEPENPSLGYQPRSFEFVNNTLTDNVGLEQAYFENGPGGEIFFVNNILRSLSVPGCGGTVARLQPKRPVAGTLNANLQYPGMSCSQPTEPMPVGLAPLDAVAFGGLLAQAHRPPIAPGPSMVGDDVICNEYPVINKDQLRTPRTCLLGAAEITKPAVIPAGFRP